MLQLVNRTISLLQANSQILPSTTSRRAATSQAFLLPTGKLLLQPHRGEPLDNWLVGVNSSKDEEIRVA